MTGLKVPETLESDRLLLRQWQETDFDPLYEMLSDVEVVKYLGGTPMDAPTAWRHMAMVIGHWQLRGFGLWAVEEKTTGHMIGRVGIWHPHSWPAIEVGYTLHPKSWGKGYATEAAQMSAKAAFDHLNLDEIISIIHQDNIASQKVAERLGETKKEARNFMGHPVFIYSMSPKEFSKTNDFSGG